MKKRLFALALGLALILTACSAGASPSPTPSASGASKTRVVTDVYGRQVTIPAKVEKIAAVGGAARFISYAGCADKLIGVNEADKKADVQKPYSWVNKDRFAKLASVGAGGSADTPYVEELIKLAPDVIFCLQDKTFVENVASKTNIPVVAIYPDGIFDKSVYDAITLIGEVMGTETHCAAVVKYMQDCCADLQKRTKDIPDTSKPTVYTGGVNFRGTHGFDGTYAKYPPFMAIGAKNVVDETGKSGGIIIDKEKVLVWDPDIIFLNPGNMSVINDDYKLNKSYYDSLKAVKNGRIYSQIAYNSNWTNIEIAIADTYYAGCVIYPEAFKDVDPIKKADEIFKVMLGYDGYYKLLTDAGYRFEKITIGK